MNFKKYHVSRNLFTGQYSQFDNQGGTGTTYAYFKIDEDFTLSFKARNNLTVPQDYYVGISANGGNNSSGVTWALGSNNTISAGDVRTVKSSTNDYHCFSFYPKNETVYNWLVENFEIMLNYGNTTEPYEPYSSEVWHDIPYYQHKTATDTLTLPAVIYPNDTTATVGLKGNMSQTGAPSPTTPIQPQETGERTENLFNINRQESTTFTTDEKYYIKGGVGNSTSVSPTVVTAAVSNNTLSVTASGTGNGVGYIIDVNPNTTYTISFDTDITLDNKTYAVMNTLTENLQMGTMISLYSKTKTITTSADTKYLYIVFRVVNNTCVYSNIMLKEGSTAPSSYIPYGYKIPILSASTTTPVYLGEVESTRQIKKLVLTGEEDWYKVSSVTAFYTNITDTLIATNSADYIKSSHYQSSMSGDNGTIRVPNNANRILIFDNYSIADDLKTYLQQQYSAGTPVCIWYVLAEPTTGIVNEPLRKIGDYADTVSGITIPTIAGKDSFDVLTTLKPSEVELTYTGWHDASAKEWDGSEWQDEQPVSLLSASSRPTLTESTPDIMDITEPEEEKE